MRIKLVALTVFDDGVLEYRTLSRFHSTRAVEDMCLNRARSRAKFLASTRSDTRTIYRLEIITTDHKTRVEEFPNESGF